MERYNACPFSFAVRLPANLLQGVTVRIYVYVDGESHYERSLACCRQCFGERADLSGLRSKCPSGGSSSYPDESPPRLRLEPRAKFFWDCYYPFLPPRPFTGRSIDRAAYFTSFTGDESDFYQICVDIRKKGFDPQVVRERKNLSDHRRNRVATDGVLEKAKGVDIGLSVRVLENAYHNVFDVCYLFTSDIDFLPVIRAIQRLGKKVVVFGYATGLGVRSELEYVPDAFVELGDHLVTYYEPA
jgi:uncharacterized LabA/DUF88 family protein